MSRRGWTILFTVGLILFLWVNGLVYSGWLR
jgi:hypothetical protein